MSGPITLTERAAERIRRHLAARGRDAALRLGIKRTGCSGYAYTLDYADGPPGDDHLVDAAGIPIRVGADALPRGPPPARAPPPRCRCWPAPSSTTCATG
jgi:Fe-S cluster assembly iron-binding protein IscA